jgi:hypothetical protein
VKCVAVGRPAAAALLLGVTIVAACESGSSDRVTPVDPDRRYEATTTVLEAPGHGAQLCLGGVAESYPPQCGGPEVVGWNWDDVDDETSASGTTWGDYHVVGTWDGERLTLTAPPGAPVRPTPNADGGLASPCDAPKGGWAFPDEDVTIEQLAEGQEAASTYAHAQRSFAGEWIDRSVNPAWTARPAGHDEYLAASNMRRAIMNYRFTRDIARHERELAARWPGPICVTKANKTRAELEAIQRTLDRELQDRLLGSSADEVTGKVYVSLWVGDADLQRRCDERFGEGVVEVAGALRPVAS